MAKQLTLTDSLKAMKVIFDFNCELGVSPNSPKSLEDSDYSPAKDYLEKVIYNNKKALNYWLNTEAMAKVGLKDIMEQEGFHKSVIDHITDEQVQKHGNVLRYAGMNAEVARETMVFAQKMYKAKFSREYNPDIILNTKKGGNPENVLSCQEVTSLLK